MIGTLSFHSVLIYILLFYCQSIRVVPAVSRISNYLSVPFDEPWPWMQPARHALGALLLEQGSNCRFFFSFFLSFCIIFNWYLFFLSCLLLTVSNLCSHSRPCL